MAFWMTGQVLHGKCVHLKVPSWGITSMIEEREGEKCWPLDHLRQIPLIHVVLLTSYSTTSLYFYSKEL